MMQTLVEHEHQMLLNFTELLSIGISEQNQSTHLFSVFCHGNHSMAITKATDIAFSFVLSRDV